MLASSPEETSPRLRDSISRLEISSVPKKVRLGFGDGNVFFRFYLSDNEYYEVFEYPSAHELKHANDGKIAILRSL